MPKTKKAKAYSKQYYADNKERLLAYAKQYRINNRESVAAQRKIDNKKYRDGHKEEKLTKRATVYHKKKEEINCIKKQLGCQLCEFDKYPRALHFHHVDPTQKSFEISQEIRDRSMKIIIHEIKKCALLCANCHAGFHSGEIAADLVPLGSEIEKYFD
jgi:hypothetical protein